MKNILNVVNIYFTVPYFFGNQFSYFKSRGYNIHLICSPSKFLKSYATIQQIQYEEISITRKISPIIDFISLIKICRYISINKIEVVASHTPKASLLAMVAAKIMKVPNRIYFRHGSLATTKTGLSRRLFLSIDRFTAYCSTKIVCVSSSLSQQSIDDNLNPSFKQTVLGKGTCGGIDSINKFNPKLINIEERSLLRKRLNIPENSFVIGYCGRLVRDKGIAELVGGFELLKKKYPKKSLYLLLVGMFEERDALSNSVRTKITSDKNIIYTGYIEDNIQLYYSLMTMFILPSYREGFGMCVLEASAMCLPVLTTRSLGCVDSIIENETGFYVDITDESICEGISRYFDTDLRDRLGSAGREMVVKYYDNLILWPEIEKLY